jgi:Homing endonuclease associated repeat
VRERAVWTEKRIVAALKDWADANGDVPTQKKWEAARRVPSAITIRRHFDSWADALAAAGFDTRSRRHGVEDQVPHASRQVSP